MKLQELIGVLNEAQVKKGSLVSLVTEIKSLTGVTIPKRTIVEVLDVKNNKKGGVLITLLSPDDEVFEIEIEDIKKFPHKIVK